LAFCGSAVPLLHFYGMTTKYRNMSHGWIYRGIYAIAIAVLSRIARIPAWQRLEVVMIGFIACLGHFPVDLSGPSQDDRQQWPWRIQQH